MSDAKRERVTMKADLDMNRATKNLQSAPGINCIFESACYMISEGGLSGARLEDNANRAGVDVAALRHEFHNEEGLFIAVISEAGRRLSAAAEEVGGRLANTEPEANLQSIVDSLFKKLSEERTSIGRLVVHLLAYPAVVGEGWLAVGLERYSLLLQAEIKKLLGLDADSGSVTLHALSVISQCLCFCLAPEKLPRVFPHMQETLPGPEVIARHVTSLSVAALRFEKRSL